MRIEDDNRKDTAIHGESVTGPGSPIRVLALDIDGVLTDGTFLLSTTGDEQKRLSLRDLDAAVRARRAGLTVLLVTGESGPMVQAIAKRLQADCVLESAKEKLTVLRDWLAKTGLGFSEVCYLGDADRDAELLRAVGLGLAPADASEMARRSARFTLRSRGGHAAVEEALTLVEGLNRGGVHESETARAPDERLLAPRPDLEGKPDGKTRSRLVTPLPDADLERLVSATAEDLRAIRGARLFVTGGSGFFGRWLLEAIARADDAWSLDLSVVVLSRDPAAFARTAPHLASHRCVRLHAGDVRSFDFPGGPFQHVLHLATVPSPPSAPKEILATILEGTRRTLDFAARSKAERFLFVSSGAVYGRLPYDLASVPEDYAGGPDPVDPLSANGEGKRAAELMAVLEGTRSGFCVTVARGFSCLGPLLRLDGQFAAGNFIRDGLAGGPIVVKGDGTPVRSYLYASDLTTWLLAIHLRGRHGRAYNVGSEGAVSIMDLAQAVARQFEPRPAVTVQGRPEAGRLPERYVPSTRRAREELGLIATVDLDSAIRRTVAWHRGTTWG